MFVDVGSSASLSARKRVAAIKTEARLCYRTLLDAAARGLWRSTMRAFYGPFNSHIGNLLPTAEDHWQSNYAVPCPAPGSIPVQLCFKHLKHVLDVFLAPVLRIANCMHRAGKLLNASSGYSPCTEFPKAFAVTMTPSSSQRQSGLAIVAGIEVLYIEPGSPWQNGVCESFNSKLPHDSLSQVELLNKKDARFKAHGGSGTSMSSIRKVRWDTYPVGVRAALGYFVSTCCALSAKSPRRHSYVITN